MGSSEARLRLQRFARLLPQLLAQKRQPLQRADLRYTNGFALVWAGSREQADAVESSAAVGERPAIDDQTGTPAMTHRKTMQVLQQERS